MNKDLEDEYTSWIEFMKSNPTPGQFHSIANGKYVSAALLYALWNTRPEEEK